ncbi:MAG: hypothetical protein KDA32_03830 [Phycisphaerales bacterium]|nr:hypothetical protein [Phycisphaerales bacterium]
MTARVHNVVWFFTLVSAVLFAAPRGVMPCLDRDCHHAQTTKADSADSTPSCCHPEKAPQHNHRVPQKPCDCPPGCPSMCGVKAPCVATWDATHVVNPTPGALLPVLAVDCPLDTRAADIFHPPRI